MVEMKLPAFFAAIALSACATGEALDTSEDVATLAAQVLVDLREAQADAIAHEDPNAASCYAVLIVHAEALPARTAGRVVGPITAFQKARNVRRLVDRGIDEEIHAACAVLVLDARTTVLRVVRLLRAGVL